MYESKDKFSYESKGKFSVVIPVFNSKDYLHACLKSVLAAMASYGNAELIIVDNGSTDGSYEILISEYGRQARILQIRGVTVGTLRNRGAALAEGEFLSFIDSDCVICPDYFQRALEVLRTQADATGAKYDLPESPHWIEETWYKIHARPTDGLVNYINSGNFVIKRRVFCSVGGFDEEMIGAEDAELCLRLSQRGFIVYEAHAVQALHLGAEKSVRVFFRKTSWRALGMLGMLRRDRTCKPILMSLVHLILCMGGLANLLIIPASLVIRLVLFVLLVNLAPIATILYRAWQIKSFYAPMQGMLLYHVYFLARFYALYRLMFVMNTSPFRVFSLKLRN